METYILCFFLIGSSFSNVDNSILESEKERLIYAKLLTVFNDLKDI